MSFLDTNLIIRFITQDNPDQAMRARVIFQQLETRTLIVRTSESVIVEAVQVLSSKALYHLPRQEIKAALTEIIALPGLQLVNKRTFLRALDLYASRNFDFVDALNVAHMERLHLRVILSFDRDFNRIPGITRQEP